MQRTAAGFLTTSKSTATRVRASGWHNGIRSAQRLAPWIAATRAMPSTSPLPALPLAMRSSVAACIRISPDATATRCDSALAATSTMCARPPRSKCVSAALDFALFVMRRGAIERGDVEFEPVTADFFEDFVEAPRVDWLADVTVGACGIGAEDILLLIRGSQH